MDDFFQSCVGKDATETIQRLILSLGEVSKVTLASYSHLPMVQDRCKLSEAEIRIVGDAISLRKERQLPFWDCAMLAVSKSEDPMDGLLDAASTHVSLRGAETTITRSDLQRDALQRVVEINSAEGRETCILSEVLTEDGTVKHLPMIDFHCPPTNAGQAAATAVCKRLFPSGALLLKSGESFHAYGLNLISTEEFFEFLGRTLLYTPIIDRAYIAHQLIERRCALRISGVSKPTPKTTQVI